MEDLPSTPVLDRIRVPSDLRSLSEPELRALAEEIRQFLVATVSKTGGHLGPNLAVVELTLALHRVFHSPRDRILWDTGHQAYVHKLLTRPKEGFARLRKLGGMSGYPNRAESEHDFIENSHASTGLSYGAGMAEARRTEPGAGRVVVVVGDGALTGGMAYEALNNIGHRQTPVIIVLNDNGRSYAPTIGGLARQLAQHLTVLNPTYHRTKGMVDRTLRRLPGGETAMEAGRRMKEGLKELVSPRTVFEALGLKYIGPLDGHNPVELEGYLRQAERLQYPVVVHVVTRKGRGYGPAEEDEIDHLHGVSAFDVSTAKPMAGRKPTYTDVFGEALVAEAEADDRISHHGIFDLTFLRAMPGLTVSAPSDAQELRDLLHTALSGASGGPFAIRFPKGTVVDGPGRPVRILPPPDWEVLRQGGAALVLATGKMVQVALDAAGLLEGEGIALTVIDARYVKPLDPRLGTWARRHPVVVTVEDNVAAGGFGSAVAETLAGMGIPVTILGVPDAFVEHGSQAELLERLGLDAEGVAAEVRRLVQDGSIAPQKALGGQPAS